MIYLELFLSFLQIGAFSFGGGYAAMPLIQNQVIEIHHWLDISEFTDLVTISQMTPGPIAVNAATFVGTKTAGHFGALAATLGCILPSCIFVTVLTFLYTKYRKMTLMQEVLGSLRPAVVAMIANAGLTILLTAFFNSGVWEWTVSNVNIFGMIYFAIALILLRRFKWNPIFVMVVCGIAEAAVTYCRQ